ncbi:hypothetical protein UMZ34_00410 [Halopseudomonas pachastrellae]|nr:hypothetical protein UMZ34_00410 [Halopseudomonas pachastrellae]
MLYVIGGLYGNRQALDAIERRLAAETQRSCGVQWRCSLVRLRPGGVSDIEQRLQRHHPLRGNVETELARVGDDFGCGCAYPEQTNADTVERSNRIHHQLQQTVDSLPGMAEQTGQSPCLAGCQGGRRAHRHYPRRRAVAAGWQCDHAQRRAPRASNNWPTGCEQRIRVLACSHTCSPAAEYR